MCYGILTDEVVAKNCPGKRLKFRGTTKGGVSVEEERGRYQMNHKLIVFKLKRVFTDNLLLMAVT